MNRHATNHRAQFYILSIVIIVATIVTFAVGVLELSSAPHASPHETSFILHNLQSEAQQAVSIGKSRNDLENVFKSFTETTESELAKEMISVDWNYTLTSSAVDATLTIKSGTTIVTDSWAIS